MRREGNPLLILRDAEVAGSDPVSTATETWTGRGLVPRPGSHDPSTSRHGRQNATHLLDPWRDSRGHPGTRLDAAPCSKRSEHLLGCGTFWIVETVGVSEETQAVAVMPGRPTSPQFSPPVSDWSPVSMEAKMEAIECIHGGMCWDVVGHAREPNP